MYKSFTDPVAPEGAPDPVSHVAPLAPADPVAPVDPVDPAGPVKLAWNVQVEAPVFL